MLDNGYYTIRIWNNVYPAEIHFDLFLEDDLEDIDLIVDHLSAPAVPNDGLGMFNHTASINRHIVQSNNLNKYNKDESAYYVNKPLSFLDSDKKHWEVTLNKLGSPECYYCKNSPDQWIFVDDDSQSHLNFIVVLSCKDHKNLGRVSEISSGSNNEEVDYHTSLNEKKFIMEDVFDSNNNKIFTKNIEIAE